MSAEWRAVQLGLEGGVPRLPCAEADRHPREGERSLLIAIGKQSDQGGPLDFLRECSKLFEQGETEGSEQRVCGENPIRGRHESNAGAAAR